MIGTCQVCETKTKHLERHHIVPRSRGGSDKNSNLIDLCIDCHSKAHDVSFSNGRNGLIKEGQKKIIDEEAQAHKYFIDSNGHDKILEYYEFLCDVKGKEYAELFICSWAIGIIKKSDVLKAIKGQTITTEIKLNLPSYER